MYFILEHNKSNELSLFKLSHTNMELEKIKKIIDGRIVDASIIQYDKKWWIFFTEEGNGWNKLFLAYSDDLFGEWNMHPQNPVKIDITSARCGGTIFEYKGKLYRPAQDCSKTYGGAISICKIKKLTTKAFEEETINHIDPFDKSFDGIHTISEFGDLTLIDSKKQQFCILKPISSIIKNLRRMIYKM
jgi:hypothetical protein